MLFSEVSYAELNARGRRKQLQAGLGTDELLFVGGGLGSTGALVGGFEISQVTKKADDIDTMAGWSYGKMAGLVAEDLDPDGRRQMTRPTDDTETGNAAPQCATGGQPFQYMDRMSTGS